MKKTTATTESSPVMKVAPTVNPERKLHVGRELLDTTWRMTVPVVIFAGIGIFLDLKLGTEPWLTLLGALIGFGFAIDLVKRQITRDQDNVT